MLRHGFVKILLLTGVLAAATLSGCEPYYVHPGPPHPAYPPQYYDYYYYPGADVYFHIYTGEYYYRSGDRWHRARTLPKSRYLDPHDRRRLEVREGKPYQQDREHRRTVAPAPQRRYERNRRLDQQERERNRKRYEEYQRYRRR